MSRQIDEFDRGAQEAATLPLWMLRGSDQIAEYALNLVRRASFGFIEPALKQREIRLVPRFEIGGDQQDRLFQIK